MFTIAAGIGLGIGERPVSTPRIISADMAIVATTPQPNPTAIRFKRGCLGGRTRAYGKGAGESSLER